jgi:hypothetical protein
MHQSTPAVTFLPTVSHIEINFTYNCLILYQQTIRSTKRAAACQLNIRKEKRCVITTQTFTRTNTTLRHFYQDTRYLYSPPLPTQNQG